MSRIAIILSILILLPQTIKAQRPNQKDWNASLGFGIFTFHTYEGSDKYKFMSLPALNIDWKDRVFLKGPGRLGVNAIKTGGFSFGAALSPYFGREENDDDNLNGLGDIKPAIAVNLFTKYSINSYFASLNYQTAITAHSYDGYTLTPSIGRRIFITKNLFSVLTASATYASKGYMQSFFGISDRQAASSKYNTYTPQEGIKDISFSTFTQMPLSSGYYTGLHLTYKKLLGQAKDSPIVKAGDDNQVTGGVIVGYRF